MCGIFGSVGATKLQNQFLSVLNTERGRDSSGIYADGTIFRCVGSLRDAILNDKVPANVVDAIVFLGHTRAATSGAVSVENCHPFKIGHIIGAHNGILVNFQELKRDYQDTYPEVLKFQVDSQMLVWLLSKFGYAGLREAECYAGMWWINLKKPEYIYLWSWKGDLAYSQEKGRILFSSDKAHLKLCGAHRIVELNEQGQIVRINIKKMTVQDMGFQPARSILCYDYKWYKGGAWDFDTFEDKGESYIVDDLWFACVHCNEVFHEDEVIKYPDGTNDCFCPRCKDPLVEASNDEVIAACEERRYFQELDKKADKNYKLLYGEKKLLK